MIAAKLNEIDEKLKNSKGKSFDKLLGMMLKLLHRFLLEFWKHKLLLGMMNNCISLTYEAQGIVGEKLNLYSSTHHMHVIDSSTYLLDS